MKKVVPVLMVLLVLFVGCKGKNENDEKAYAAISTKNFAEQQVAYVKMKGAYEKMKDAYAKIFGYIGKMKMFPAGAPFAVFYTNPKEVKPKDNIWEALVPVKGKIKDGGGVNIRTFPAFKALVIYYEGDFGTKKHGDCYALMGKYFKAKKVTPAGPPLEVYLATKGIMGAKKNKIQIVFPIK